jgi:hypothetical protein
MHLVLHSLNQGFSTLVTRLPCPTEDKHENHNPRALLSLFLFSNGDGFSDVMEDFEVESILPAKVVIVGCLVSVLLLWIDGR